MSREILSYDAFKAITGNYMDVYANCIAESFEDYKKINSFNLSLDTFADFEIRTRASIIHDRICGRIKDKFQDKPTIKAGKWNHIFGLNFDDKIFLRHKKFKRGGIISCFKTPQHKAFLKQGHIEGIPDKPVFIIGGYMPNDTFTELIGVYFSCWTANGVEWFVKVGEYVSEQGIIMFPQAENVELNKKKRTKLKQPQQDEKIVVNKS